MGAKLKLGDLGHPLHQTQDLRPEEVLDLLRADKGVLKSVVKKRGGNRIHIHLEVRENSRHRKGMGKVGLPTLSPLLVMRTRREEVSPDDNVQIRVRSVAGNGV